MDRGVATGVSVGVLAPRNLADRLTLFKPGGQIMPLTLCTASPPKFKKLSTPLNGWLSVSWYNVVWADYYPLMK